jgi:glycosyltransferase involved in cell wall biosynthesis
MLITVVLPVYGRADLLAEAWQSLKLQSDPEWQLLIADDGSDDYTANWIESEPAKDCRTNWIRRKHNIGLFANLNAALDTLPIHSWVLLLCSDDRLLPDAILNIKNLLRDWPEVSWILSTHLSIDNSGKPTAATSFKDHNCFSLNSRTIAASEFIPLLLQHGSINGNLTGMAFSMHLWRDAGEFRSDWCHAADWEWLIRAVEQAPVLLSRAPIAEVRSHGSQLSNKNRFSGDELHEVAAVQLALINHPLLRAEPQRFSWAAHRMQFQLWNLIKQIINFHWHGVGPGLIKIQRTVGLLPCFIALLAFLPKRISGRLFSP